MRVPATIRHRSTDWVLQFINIVFLLLLYFLVNGTIAEAPRPDIALPVSVEHLAGQPPYDAVYIGANGSMTFRGTAVELGNIASAIGSRSRTTVVADKSLPAASLVVLMGQLSEAGAGQLTLVTANRTGP